MEYITLNNNIKMPMAGIGTFLLTPDEAEASVPQRPPVRIPPHRYSKRLRKRESRRPRYQKIRRPKGRHLPGD